MVLETSLNDKKERVKELEVTLEEKEKNYQFLVAEYSALSVNKPREQVKDDTLSE